MTEGHSQRRYRWINLGTRRCWGLVGSLFATVAQVSGVTSIFEAMRDREEYFDQPMLKCGSSSQYPIEPSRVTGTNWPIPIRLDLNLDMGSADGRMRAFQGGQWLQLGWSHD